MPIYPVECDLKVMRGPFRPFVLGIPAVKQIECLSGVIGRILVRAAVPRGTNCQVKGMGNARIAAFLLRPFQCDIRQIVGTRRAFSKILNFAFRHLDFGTAQKEGIKVRSPFRGLRSGLPVRLGR